MGRFISTDTSVMLGWQVIQSINILRDGKDDEGMPVNCCPVCCGPCASLLKALSDPGMLATLNNLLMEHPYVKSGWSYWKNKGQTLKVNKIKRMWFKPDGSRKAICMMSNGIDVSHQVHKASWKDCVL